jgi:hypothetical protein
MQKTIPAFFILALAALACTLPSNAPRLEIPPTAMVQPPTSQPPLEAPTITPSPLPPNPPGGINVSLDSTLAAGYVINLIPAVSDESQAGPWGVAPEHLEIDLPNYPLQGKFHKPKIYIYPVAGLASMNQGAGFNIKTLQDLLAADANAPIDPASLPGVFFFNAGGIFEAKAYRLPFNNGNGARWLTQYAQYFAPVNNHELFYLYQGLTSDGAYYVIAILPINHPSLAADDKIDAPVPAGGIPFPANPSADMNAYYTQITDMLDITLAGAFTPHLEELDSMMALMKIFPSP